MLMTFFDCSGKQKLMKVNRGHFARIECLVMCCLNRNDLDQTARCGILLGV